MDDAEEEAQIVENLREERENLGNNLSEVGNGKVGCFERVVNEGRVVR